MKLLFRGLLLISSLLVIFLIAGMMLPEKIQIESNVVINAPIEKIYSQTTDYKAMAKWYSWSVKDKNIEYTYEGETTGKGAIMHWRSQVDEIGVGSQKIIEADKYKTVKNIIAISGMPRAYSIFKINELDKGIELTWLFDMRTGYNIPARIKALSMKDDIKEHYSQSLQRLKVAME